MTKAPRRIVPGLAMLLAFPALGAAAESEGPPPDFVVGDYVLVGREPDGGATYSGTARIDMVDGPADSLILQRRVGTSTVTARGAFEVPSPPGEGRVLRFRWQEPQPVVMTCLIGSDLDNYARLTCLWSRAGAETDLPGLEAMFPTGAWPDSQK